MSKPSSKKQRPAKPIHPPAKPKPKQPTAYVMPADLRNQIVTAIRSSQTITIGIAADIMGALLQLQPLGASEAASPPESADEPADG